MAKPNESGRIVVEGDWIVYTLAQDDWWRVSVDEIRLVGEYTNDHGPFVDDYFFVFLTKDRYFEASFYADGREAMLAELGRRLQHELCTGLWHSTNLASRVLWPAHLEGHPVYDLVPEARAESVWARLRQWILPRVHMYFTDEVRRELEK